MIRPLSLAFRALCGNLAIISARLRSLLDTQLILYTFLNKYVFT